MRRLQGRLYGGFLVKDCYERFAWEFLSLQWELWVSKSPGEGRE